ncbi:MAG: serine hydrolase domain-containing protein [Kofleriaceae bacterium]
MTSRHWLLLSLTALALQGCGAAPAPQAPAPATTMPAPGDLGVDLAGLSAKLPAFIDSVSMGDPNQAFSGYVLVAQHDQPIFSRAYGFADRARATPATADTSFRVGSVTKQFTAAAILKLEEQGKLSVHDPIGKHLPEYPAPGRELTLHQLLTHTSGIPDLLADPEVQARPAQRYTPAELLALFWDKPLLFPAGSRFAYSNSNYDVLGAIIERVSGRSYAAFLAEELFAPAGLTRTEVGDAEGAADRAEGYQHEGEQLVQSGPMDMSGPYAAGGVRSTASDLVRWHRALSGDAILSAASRAKLYAPALNDYAYAWVVKSIQGHPAVWHNGGIDGFSTIYWRVPDADLVVVAWSNVLDVSADPIGRAAVEAALGGPARPLTKWIPGVLDLAVVARVTGEYELTKASQEALLEQKLSPGLIAAILSVSVSATEHGIAMKPVGQSAVELLPTQDGAFFAVGPQLRLRFALPATGPASAVTLEQGSLTIEYVRK